MTYELAKQLKDAGFPFKKKPYHAVYRDNSPVVSNPTGTDWEDYAYYPELSELIKACGDDFLMLQYVTLSVDGSRAWSTRGKNVDWTGAYATPEEAVARLWLAIQDKAHKA